MGLRKKVVSVLRSEFSDKPVGPEGPFSAGFGPIDLIFVLLCSGQQPKLGEQGGAQRPLVGERSNPKGMGRAAPSSGRAP